jgi:hypothetical protein
MSQPVIESDERPHADAEDESKAAQIKDHALGPLGREDHELLIQSGDIADVG